MNCAITNHPEPQTLEALSASLPHIQQSPKLDGTLALIVRRPQVDAREVLAEGQHEALAADLIQPGLVRVGDVVRKMPGASQTSAHLTS